MGGLHKNDRHSGAQPKAVNPESINTEPEASGPTPERTLSWWCSWIPDRKARTPAMPGLA